MRRVSAILLAGTLANLGAQPPQLVYLFPAGGQRGTTVEVRVGGLNFHDQAHFEMLGRGIRFPGTIQETRIVWFEGPIIPQPDSQAGENYPRDYAARLVIGADAPLDEQRARCWTSQGTSPSLPFVVGDLPEVVEVEAAGRPIHQTVALPVTVNGRIFPREDVDEWTFAAKEGETIVCDAATRQLGSPLEAVLTVLDPAGQPVRLTGSPRRGDPRRWFTAAVAGPHTIRITDASHGGLQHYVYRLTLQSGGRVDHAFPLGGKRGQPLDLRIQGPGLAAQPCAARLADLPGEFQWVELKDAGRSLGRIRLHVDELSEIVEPAPAAPQSVPLMLNGRVEKPGETDEWSLRLAEKVPVTLDLIAARLESPLDGVLRILDEAGTVLATNDDRTSDQPDPLLVFTPPKAGVYRVRVSDRFASRGGPAFAYRLRATAMSSPDFKLTLGSETLTLLREAPKTDDPKKPATPNPKLRVSVERMGGFTGEVRLTLSGLPAGMSATGLVIPPGQPHADVTLSAPQSSTIATHRVTVRGEATLADRNATREALAIRGLSQASADHVLVAVGLPTPFKFTGQFQLATSQPTGTVVSRHYKIQPGGVAGPFVARLADKQGRHVQGVRGPILELPAGTTEFDYPITYPARMEIGRTSRIQIMLTTVVTDADGSKHTVCYSSFEGSEQVIAITSENLVALSIASPSYLARPNALLTLPVHVRRAPQLGAGPMKVELLVPAHMRGIKAPALMLAAGVEEGELRVELGSELGPFNMPLTLRASTASGVLFFGEAQVEFAEPGAK